jgi:hypothetical protein
MAESVFSGTFDVVADHARRADSVIFNPITVYSFLVSTTRF